MSSFSDLGPLQSPGTPQLIATDEMKGLRTQWSQWSQKEDSPISQEALPTSTTSDASLKSTTKAFTSKLSTLMNKQGTWGSKDTKRQAVAKYIGQQSDTVAVEHRVTEDQAKTVLHFGKDKNVTSEWSLTGKDTTDGRNARAMIRAAILIAIDKGASLEEVKSLRSAMVGDDKTTNGDRESMLNQVRNSSDGKLPQSHQLQEEPQLQAVQTQPQLTPPSLEDVEWANMAMGRDLPVGVKYMSASTGVEQQGISLPDMEDREDNVHLAPFAMINSYTRQDGYRHINEALREAQGDISQLPPDIKAFVEIANQGLDQLPDFQGWVMRGGGKAHRFTPEQGYGIGQVVSNPSFVSTSVDKQWRGKECQMLILSKHGKDISNFSEQYDTDGREVLFKPNTQFEVLDRIDPGDQRHPGPAGKTYIIMQEKD